MINYNQKKEKNKPSFRVNQNTVFQQKEPELLSENVDSRAGQIQYKMQILLKGHNANLKVLPLIKYGIIWATK